MTVSRTGKKGTHARLRPASRNKRVRVNAGLKGITKTVDDRPTAKRTSKEEWVLRCVARAVGTKGNFVTADDVASDIILELLDAGGFNWEEEEIERFCRKRAAYMVLRHISRRERSECEFSLQDGEAFNIFNIVAVQRSMQDTVVDAHNAADLLPLLPTQHRAALEILCDGGNPLDVAEELGMTPWDAIVLIKEAREWIGRVGPLDEAA